MLCIISKFIRANKAFFPALSPIVHVKITHNSPNYTQIIYDTFINVFDTDIFSEFVQHRVEGCGFAELCCSRTGSGLRGRGFVIQNMSSSSTSITRKSVSGCKNFEDMVVVGVGVKRTKEEEEGRIQFGHGQPANYAM